MTITVLGGLGFPAAAFQALIGGEPVDLPLDIEQAVDPFEGFERQSLLRQALIDAQPPQVPTVICRVSIGPHKAISTAR